MRVKYEGLKDFVLTCLQEGALGSDEIYQSARDLYNYGRDLKTFKKYIANIRSRYILRGFNKNKDNSKPIVIESSYTIKNVSSEDKEEEFINMIQKGKMINVYDLCDELHCYPNEIMQMVSKCKNEGYNILKRDNNLWLSDHLVEGPPDIPRIADKEIIFGIMSDLHFGSRATQITAMNEFTEECKRRGVEYIFVPGDVVCGYRVYPGQEMEIYVAQAEEQENSVIANLPEGFTYYLLGGNHDYSFIKRGGGHNIIRSLCNKRDDFIYCGYDWAEFEILEGVSLAMWHPKGANPYSISYRMQKGIEQIAFDELSKVVSGLKNKPTLRFILVGHLHIQMQSLFGSIMGLQCGCFEGTTALLKAKKLVPAIGGYIVEASLDRTGLLKDYTVKFHLYPEIINDYKNYKHTVPEDDEIEPMFKW